MGAGVLGGGAQRHRRAHPARTPGGAPRRSHVPRRPARTRRPDGVDSAGLGCGRAQLAHQHLLVRRARRIRLLDGVRPPEPRPRRRQRHSPDQQPPGNRALLQPARPADRRGSDGRGEADRLRHAPLQHRLEGRHLDRPVARLGSRNPAGDRQPSHLDEPLRPGFRPQMGELGGVSAPGPPGLAGHLRVLRDGAEEPLREVHLRVRRPGVGGRGPRLEGYRRGRGQLRREARGTQLEERRRGKPRGLAGRTLSLLSERPDGLDRCRGWHLGQRLGQVGASAAPARPSREALERAHLARRIPALLLRDELPSPALPEGGTREARCLFLPRLQPDVDEPGRVYLAGGPAG